MNAGCLKVGVRLYNFFFMKLVHLILLKVIKVVLIHTTVYGNKENYQLGCIVLTSHQISKTYTKGDSWQSMRRIYTLSLVQK